MHHGVRRIAALASAAAVSACASGGSLTGGGGSVAVPQNYRQQIAAKLRQWEDVSTIRSAEITGPHDKFVGLLFGGTRPSVCVKLGMPNMIGGAGTYYYVFYFNGGVVDGYKQGAAFQEQVAMVGCGSEPLTRFTELART